MFYDSSLYERIQLSLVITADYEHSRSFIDHVFSSQQLAQAVITSNFFQSRVILCSYNDAVNLLNQQILDDLNDVERMFFSFDSVVFEDDDDSHELSTKYLQSLNSFDFSSSQLALKVDASIMLLRNLHFHEDLCNETRLIVTRLHRDCVERRIFEEVWNDESRLIPRIKLISKKDDYSWILTRKQFLIRLCFTMIINKLQNQSLFIVDIDLSENCFNHEQLYVALSRARDVHRLTILYRLDRDRYVDIVVFSKILLMSESVM